MSGWILNRDESTIVSSINYCNTDQNYANYAILIHKATYKADQVNSQTSVEHTACQNVDCVKKHNVTLFL